MAILGKERLVPLGVNSLFVFTYVSRDKNTG